MMKAPLLSKIMLETTLFEENLMKRLALVHFAYYRATTSVMIWGCMASNGIGRLHVCEGIKNASKYAAVLETKLLASARSLFPDEYWIFQDDNAPCH